MSATEPQKLSTAPARIVRLDGRTHLASILVGIATVTSAVLTWAFWNRYHAVAGYVRGDGSVGLADLGAVDKLSFIAASIDFAALGATAIAFIAWLWRARRNSEALSDYRHRRAKGWVIGSWICPFVNLFFPPMIINDVYWASHSAGPPRHSEYRPGNAVVGWWWAGWLTTNAINWYIVQTDEVSANSFRTVAVAQTIVTLTTACSAALLITVMRRLTAIQREAVMEVRA